MSRLRSVRLSRRQQAFVLALIPVVFAFSVWGLQGPTAAGEDPASALVTQGNMVVSVGGVGRIVQAKAPGAIARPSAPSGGAGAGGSAPTAASDAPADAVFPRTTGQIKRYLVRRGQRVVAGQTLAVLNDGGVAAAAMNQARNDLATARLELRQKRTSDPLKGTKPAPAEIAAERSEITAMEAKLNQLLKGARRADVMVAWQELRKAEADLETARGGTPAAQGDALLIARRALDAAEGRLERALTPDPADVSVATAELKKAEADLAVLLQTPEGPLPEEIAAAKQAVTNAEVTLAERKAAVPPDPAAIRAAEQELALAKSDLAKLQRQPRGPTAEEIASGRQAVDAARAKLNKLLRPGNSADVRTARHEVEVARAEVRRLEAGPSKATVASGRAAVEAAQAKLNQLLGPPLAADVAAARFDIRRAEAELALLNTRGAPGSPDDIGLARLRVEGAQDRLRAARQTMRLLTVRSPSSGTVTALTSVHGAPVDTTTPIATVSNLDELAVTVSLSEFDVARVRPGLKAELSVDAFPEESFTGRVLFAAATGVENNGLVSFPVQIGINEAEGLKPGMNVSVSIVVARKGKAIQVPHEAVNQEGDEPTVSVINAGGDPTVRTVELGLENNKNVEILKGLRKGERVELVAVAPAGEE